MLKVEVLMLDTFVSKIWDMVELVKYNQELSKYSRRRRYIWFAALDYAEYIDQKPFYIKTCGGVLK